MLDQLVFRPQLRSWYVAWFLLRRAIASVLLVGLAQYQVVRQAALFFCMVLFLFLQFRLKPYSLSRDNQFAMLALGALVVVSALELYRIEVITSAFRDGNVVELWQIDVVIYTQAACVVVCVLVWMIKHVRAWGAAIRRFHRTRAQRRFRAAMDAISPLARRWRQRRAEAELVSALPASSMLGNSRNASPEPDAVPQAGETWRLERLPAPLSPPTHTASLVVDKPGGNV